MTSQEIRTVLQIMFAVSETIRETCAKSSDGYVISGHLYSALLTHFPSMSATVFQQMLERIEGAGLIKTHSDTIVWVGPEFKES